MVPMDDLTQQLHVHVKSGEKIDPPSNPTERRPWTRFLLSALIATGPGERRRTNAEVCLLFLIPRVGLER